MKSSSSFDTTRALSKALEAMAKFQGRMVEAGLIGKVKRENAYFDEAIGLKGDRGAFEAWNVFGGYGWTALYVSPPCSASRSRVLIVTFLFYNSGEANTVIPTTAVHASSPPYVLRQIPSGVSFHELSGVRAIHIGETTFDAFYWDVRLGL
jgi:hypothetical protein